MIPVLTHEKTLAARNQLFKPRKVVFETLLFDAFGTLRTPGQATSALRVFPFPYAALLQG